MSARAHKHGCTDRTHTRIIPELAIQVSVALVLQRAFSVLLFSSPSLLCDISSFLFSSFITMYSPPADVLLVPWAPSRVSCSLTVLREDELCLQLMATITSEQFQNILTFSCFNIWNMHLGVILSGFRCLSSLVVCQNIPSSVLGHCVLEQIESSFWCFNWWGWWQSEYISRYWWDSHSHQLFLLDWWSSSGSTEGESSANHILLESSDLCHTCSQPHALGRL